MWSKSMLLIAAIFSAVCSYWITDSVWQARWDAKLLSDAAALQVANNAIRERENRITELQAEAENHAKTLQAKHAESLAAANAVSERLQHALSEHMQRPAVTHSPTVAERAAAATDRLVLAELLRRADSRAGALAEYADRARAAGLICEQKYNALRGD